jgi:hypothetical protein
MTAEARRDELQRFSNWMKRRYESKYVEDHDLIVLGGFNTPKLTDEIFAALPYRPELDVIPW